MDIENRMVVDEEWRDYKDYADEEYYNDAPDWFEEED